MHNAAVDERVGQLADKPTRRNWYIDVSAHAEM